ncbi:MAG TPA: class II glutamine amidotransferase, partial [Sulfitobacter pontiacus]|nr:class II glutamine amidotransferase [Sulfitobacter pontiacus]
SAIFASEPLTEDGSDWLHIRFGEMVSLRRVGGKISKTITKLDV